MKQFQGLFSNFTLQTSNFAASPHWHCGDYFEMTEAEIRAVNELLKIRRKELLEKDREIKGFEVSTGKGTDYSGHCWVELVPKRLD